ncbi:hypothetical protein BDQ17DRAFT_1365692 [Cyathus striatus]|nr:hypothetical protein BDQ17DRAFT_1365692 [Cyathus striatus]
MSAPEVAEQLIITASPFQEGKLPQALQDQIGAIRTCLTTWLSTVADCRRGVRGSAERLETAMENLTNLTVADEYAPFKKVLLSCTKCYWIALISSFDEEEKEEMARRLDLVPPYGKRVPEFDGSKCVKEPGKLSEREYEGLMRTVHLLGEVGVHTWEED